MGLDSAQSMYFFKHKKDGKNLQSNIITAILQWRILVGLLLVILVTICSPLINIFIFKNPISLLCYSIAFTNVFFSQLLVQSTEVLRLLFRPYRYIFLSIAQSALAAVLILLFVIYFNYDIKGYFLGLLISSATLSVLGWYYIREYINFRKFHFEWWPKLIRFELLLYQRL